MARLVVVFRNSSWYVVLQLAMICNPCVYTISQASGHSEPQANSNRVFLWSRAIQLGEKSLWRKAPKYVIWLWVWDVFHAQALTSTDNSNRVILKLSANLDFVHTYANVCQ